MGGDRLKNARFALLYADERDVALWRESLKEAGYTNVAYIDICAFDWYRQCINAKPELYILRPPGLINFFKSMFDERVRILASTPLARFYPSVLESDLYENKKNLAYWLEANKIPHPETWVFYKKDEMLEWIASAKFPLVGKINIGASGKGVKTIRNVHQARNYAETAFARGLKPYVGPSLSHGSLWSKMKNSIRKKGLIRSRLASYRATLSESQKYCIIQEYVPHDYEWRVVRIGPSYFAHKKMVHNSKASGSLVKEYSKPPLCLLNFVKNVCVNNNLTSVAIDVFEGKNGYLINEIQCYFGQSDTFQMMVDGVPGRFIYGDSWQFEAGDFALDQCFPLRIEHIESII